MGFLIDTSVWIEVERGRMRVESVVAITGDSPVYVSPVTIAELRYGAEIAVDPDIRARRLAGVRKIEDRPILPIDGGTGEVFGNLGALLAKGGRGKDFRIQDLWIASQAVQHGLTVLTHNRKDFEDIPGLRLTVVET